MDRKIFLIIISALILCCPGRISHALTVDKDTSGVTGPVVPQEDILDRLENEAGSKYSSTWKKVFSFIGLTKPSSVAGARAYEGKNYDLSLQKFMEAKLDNPESPQLSFNIGNAQFRKKKYDEAIRAYEEALMGNDAGTSSSAYYNLGNAHFRKGEFAIQQGDQQGIQSYRTAMANYKKSLDINPDNTDAKRNIEVVQARIKELLERQEQQQDQNQQQKDQQPPPKPSEKAKEVLARAMQLVKQRKYQEAKQLLETIIQEDATAASFQQHVKRIDDVLNIMAGKAPAPPVPQDPRSQQQGLGVI